MMSFRVKSKDLYGLPERKVFSRLANTDSAANPYRLYSIDKFPHDIFDPIGLYSGIPYITGHSKTHDESIMWVTASETWVDLSDHKNEKLVNFISDAGVMEFFLFGNLMEGPKKQVKMLSKITGLPFLPSLHSLGFHYSRWEETSAAHIMDLN